MIKSYQRGHEIIFVNNKWVYADDLTTIDDERPCIRCGQMPTRDGHDWCMQDKKHIISACCGHGISNLIMINL